MPAEKEGERGRDQHLDVEILPPRDLLCIRKIKTSCRKGHLPSSVREAVAARGSTAQKGSVVSEAQARQLLDTLTHKSLFSSQGGMCKSPGVCSIEEEESEASHAPDTGASALPQGPPHLQQRVSGQFLGPTQQWSNCWHPKVLGSPKCRTE